MSYSYKNFNYDKLLKVLNEVKSTTKYFNNIKETQDNVLVTCPYHKGGQERKPSCGIHKDTLVYHCFTCGAKGTLFDMMNDINHPINLEQIKNDRDDMNLKIGLRDKRKEELHVVHPDYTVGLTRYLQSRGLTHEICADYLIGYKDNLVVFPIRNLKGDIIYYTTRDTTKKEYTLTIAEKPIYGWYELNRKKVDYCFITESVFNCLSLVSWGYNAIALLGTGAKNQLEILRQSGIRQFIICMDGDDAGRQGTKKIKENLQNHIITSIYIYEGKDVNDLSKEEFEQLLIEQNVKFH